VIELKTEFSPVEPLTLALVAPGPPPPTVTVIGDPAETANPDAVKNPPAPPPPPES
jgi:hypothetical protein